MSLDELDSYSNSTDTSEEVPNDRRHQTTCSIAAARPATKPPTPTIALRSAAPVVFAVGVADVPDGVKAAVVLSAVAFDGAIGLGAGVLAVELVN